jgi:predicted phosphodiesterase
LAPSVTGGAGAYQLAHAQKPDVVVLSGDITQRAPASSTLHEGSSTGESSGLMAIPKSRYPAVQCLARYSVLTRNYPGVWPDLEPEFSADHYCIGQHDSTAASQGWRNIAAQIDRVAQRLRQAPAGRCASWLHQPVLAIRPGDKANLLHGHREAVPAWSAAGADIIMGGHIHLPYVRSLRTTFDGLPRDIWTVQAGTAVSSRIRERVPNSVNVIRCNGAIGTRECIVERWDFRSPTSVSSCTRSSTAFSRR